MKSEAKPKYIALGVEFVKSVFPQAVLETNEDMLAARVVVDGHTILIDVSKSYGGSFKDWLTIEVLPNQFSGYGSTNDRSIRKDVTYKQPVYTEKQKERLVSILETVKSQDAEHVAKMEWREKRGNEVRTQVEKVRERGFEITGDTCYRAAPATTFTVNGKGSFSISTSVKSLEKLEKVLAILNEE